MSFAKAHCHPDFSKPMRTSPIPAKNSANCIGAFYGTFECPELEKVVLSNAPYAPQTKTYNKVRYTMTGCGDRVFENIMNPKAVHLVRRSNIWGRVR